MYSILASRVQLRSAAKDQIRASQFRSPYADPVKKESAKVLFVRRDGKYYLAEFWGILDKRVVTAEFEHRGQASEQQREVSLTYP